MIRNKKILRVWISVLVIIIGILFSPITKAHTVEDEITLEQIYRVIETEENQDIQEIEEKVKPLYFKYTEKDVYMVGNTVFHEVGILFAYCSEEDATRAAKLTASCIVNRAKMNYAFLGKKIEQQIYANGQYACSSKITNQRQKEVPEKFYDIAEEILADGPLVSSRLVYQAQFEQGEVVDNIYNQYFGLVSEECYVSYTKEAY